MKQRQASYSFSLGWIVAVIMISLSAFVASTALFMHIDTLSGRIVQLEKNEVTLERQLASYQKVRCEPSAEVMSPNTITDYTIEIDGLTRSYQVHTPYSYDSQLRYPVIISFDGIEGSADRMRAYSGLDGLPAIVVYTDALVGKAGFTAWQGAPYSLDGDSDVQFIRQLLQTLPGQYCTDNARIFAVGMSNGGNFATIVGCELGDQIKAVASVSGAYYTTCTPEQRTPSLLMLHSTEDRQVPFEGAPARRLPAISVYAKDRAETRHCRVSNPVVNDPQLTTYTWKDCVDSSLLRLIVLHNQPHGWLQMPKTAPETQTTADYIWKFFTDATYYSN